MIYNNSTKQTNEHDKYLTVSLTASLLFKLPSIYLSIYLSVTKYKLTTF